MLWRVGERGKISRPMEWLRAHSDIAAWLGPLIALLAAIVQNRKHLFDFNWRSFTIYLTFFSLTGVELSSSFDKETKERIQVIWFMSFLFIVWDYFPATARKRSPD
jgi:hypothetical protein